LLVLSCILVSGVAQNDNVPVIGKEDIPHLTILSEQEFTGKSLWGYINGGADLYLEYGFKKLIVQEIEKDKILLKVNIYEMETAKETFGIFSANVHKCKTRNILKENDCQGPYQYQVFKGNYYVSIVNETGKSDAGEFSLEIGSILLGKMKDVQLHVPVLFTSTDLTVHQGKLKFISGRLGLQNIITDWSDYFDGLENYSVWYLPLDDIKIAYIEFDRNEDSEHFLNQTTNAIQMNNWKLNDNDLVILEARIINTDSEKYSKMIDAYIN